MNKKMKKLMGEHDILSQSLILVEDVAKGEMRVQAGSRKILKNCRVMKIDYDPMKVLKLHCPHCGDRLLPIQNEKGEIVEYKCVSGLHLGGTRFRFVKKKGKKG